MCVAPTATFPVAGVSQHRHIWGHMDLTFSRLKACELVADDGTQDQPEPQKQRQSK